MPSEHEALWTQQLVRELWRAHILTPLPGKEPRLLGCPARSLVTLPTELSRLPVTTISVSLITMMDCSSTHHHGQTTVTCFVSLSVQDLRAGSNVHVLTKPSYSDRKRRSFRPPHRPRLLQMQQTMAKEKQCRLPFHIKAFRSEGDSFGHRVHITPTASHIYFDTRSHHHLANTESRRKPKAPSIATICMKI